MIWLTIQFALWFRAARSRSPPRQLARVVARQDAANSVPAGRPGQSAAPRTTTAAWTPSARGQITAKAAASGVGQVGSPSRSPSVSSSCRADADHQRDRGRPDRLLPPPASQTGPADAAAIPVPGPETASRRRARVDGGGVRHPGAPAVGLMLFLVRPAAGGRGARPGRRRGPGRRPGGSVARFGGGRAGRRGPGRTDDVGAQLCQPPEVRGYTPGSTAVVVTLHCTVNLTFVSGARWQSPVTRSRRWTRSWPGRLLMRERGSRDAVRVCCSPSPR